MTARPHHLRLVVANDDIVAAGRRVRLAWSTSAACLPAADPKRAALLAEAAVAVMPRAAVSSGAADLAPQGLPAPTAARSAVPFEGKQELWLGLEQLGLLEELALLRRERRVAVAGDVPVETAAAAPALGADYVLRLLRGAPAAFGPPARTRRPAALRARAWRHTLVPGLVALLLGAAALVRRTLSFF